MTVIQELREALAAKSEHSALLAFGNYTLKKEAGKGQQGVIVLAKNGIGKLVVLKLCDPNDAATSVDDFKREVKHLITFQHRNVAGAFTGGFAHWDANGSTWSVHETFEGVTSSSADTVYFYVRDDIPDGCEACLNTLRDTDGVIDDSSVDLSAEAAMFEQMASHIASALEYLHDKKNVVHKDVKPANIRYRPSDESFVLTDFGFARHPDSAADKVFVPRTEIEDLISVQHGKWHLNDIAQLARVLYTVFEKVEAVYDTAHAAGIRAALKKAFDPDLKMRHPTIREFRKNLEPYFEASPNRQWKLIVRTGECLTPPLFGRFDARLRIPISGSIHTSKEVRAIIDTKAFQRLRGVKQLGPTSLVFPGAIHTRFEHSLGTYALALRYLERLALNVHFRSIAGTALNETVQLAVMAALLHDVGHYAYSHWIEEIEKVPGSIEIPSHEKRARAILENDLNDVIKNTWGLNVDELASVIEGKPKDDRGRIVDSLINSVIDVDKLDYLARDSTHCGLAYGLGYDIERLLDSLWVNEETNKLALTDKGRSLPLAIVTSRNIMYQEVYWHKTVRACDSMFKRLFFETARLVNVNIVVEKWLELPDDQFLEKISQAVGKHEKLANLAAPFMRVNRELFKPAYVYSKAMNVSGSTKMFFANVTQRWEYSKMVEKCSKLADVLSVIGRKVDPLEILIDTAPVKHGEKYEIKKFQIWNLRSERWESLPAEIASQDDYLDSTQQAYIFCHPKHYPSLRKLSLDQWDSILGSI